MVVQGLGLSAVLFCDFVIPKGLEILLWIFESGQEIGK
jgi:hypothetical protein